MVDNYYLYLQMGKQTFRLSGLSKDDQQWKWHLMILSDSPIDYMHLMLSVQTADIRANTHFYLTCF